MIFQRFNWIRKSLVNNKSRANYSCSEWHKLQQKHQVYLEAIPIKKLPCNENALLQFWFRFSIHCNRKRKIWIRSAFLLLRSQVCLSFAIKTMDFRNKGGRLIVFGFNWQTFRSSILYQKAYQKVVHLLGSSMCIVQSLFSFLHHLSNLTKKQFYR